MTQSVSGYFVRSRTGILCFWKAWHRPTTTTSIPRLAVVQNSSSVHQQASSVCIRLYSSRGNPKNSMEAKEISDRLVLHQALSREDWRLPVDPKRVLVLFFPWLGAKEKHVDRYRELYTSKGLDVLTVRSQPTDFLWPPNSFTLAKHTVKTLDRLRDEYDHLILHSMSIGSYNLTVLCMLARKLDNHSHLMDKFRGVIFDSIVVGAGKGGVIKETESISEQNGKQVHALDRMIKGVARSVSKSGIIQSMVTLAARAYFASTKKHTVDFYEKALDVVRDEPVQVPTLVFASKDDPMSDAVVLQKLVEIWKTNSNLPVTLCLWDNSRHAQHYIYHMEEYKAAQDDFLSQLFSKMNKKAKL